MEWAESVSSNRERVVEELTQGRELASQLRMILDSTAVVGDGGGVGSAEVIVVNKILGSFANTLWILKGEESGEDQAQANSGGGSGSGADSSSWGASLDQHVAVKCEEDFQESSKSTPIFKDRRGSYKRRKTSHSWTRETPALTDDGHSWRKYGQKVILNADYPRNYFRCTHKADQNCKATKHVQKIQDHPPVYRTTYFGNHICRDYLRASELIVDCSSPRDASDFISFDNTFIANNKQDHPFLSAFSMSVKKEELVVKEGVRAHSPPPCDNLVSSNAMPLESPGGMSAFSSTMDNFDHDAVISGLIRGAYWFDDEVMDFSF